MPEKTDYGTKRTIILLNENDETLTKIRASAMSKGKSYSFGKVLNSALLYALDKGFDQEKLVKLAEETF